MTRTVLTLSACALALTAICLAAGDEPAAPQRAEKTAVQTAPKRPAKVAETVPAAATVKGPVASGAGSEKDSAKNSADEEAIRKTGATFAKAYDDADAKAAAAHFTADAEYVDEQGNIYQGRQAI